MTASDDRASVSHACAVHLGFSGAHELFPGIADPQRRAKFTDELTRQVTNKLIQLRSHPRLPLHEGHFFVGVLPIGNAGDGVLADACDGAGIAQRVFLPLPRDELLAAKNPRAPFDDDFSPAQREKALQRLQRPTVLQERVVSVAAERAARRTDTRAEILRQADIAVILQPKHRDGLGKPGGTNAFAEHAVRSSKPLYALTFWIDENQKLHVYDELRYPRDLTWAPPQLPAVLPPPALSPDDRIGRITAECDEQAAICNAQCTRASTTTVRRYLALIAVATLVALLVVMFRNHPAGAIAWLLSLAPALALAAGAFALRRGLFVPTAQIRQRWTDLQLAAEIARSVQAFDADVADPAAGRPAFPGQPQDFSFLFAAALPDDAHSLARTLAVMHLRQLRGARTFDWQETRERYVRGRLAWAISAYESKRENVRQHVRTVGRQLAGLGAFATTVFVAALAFPAPATQFAGTVATTLALLALLSSVAALAFHAQRCLFKHRLRALVCAELVERLQHLSQRLQRAPNEREFLHLQAETETRLLAATLDWYRWRRADS